MDIMNSAAIPNNVSVATHRLQSLRKSLGKKGIIESYDYEIQKLLRSNYAEEVPQNEIYQAKRIWYLPHHGVVTSKKPDKLRVVFDCSAKFKGESTNGKCLQGPHLNNNPLSILLNFRVHSYGKMADIEAMYNQVKIANKDKDATE